MPRLEQLTCQCHMGANREAKQRKQVWVFEENSKYLKKAFK